MNDSMREMQRLLREIAEHLSSGAKVDARKAVTKLQRIADLASTSALSIQMRR
jgi:hypothetical protein